MSAPLAPDRLAAPVYAAFEGLHALVIEASSPEGQAYWPHRSHRLTRGQTARAFCGRAARFGCEGRRLASAVTPEAAGSSPVDPAISLARARSLTGSLPSGTPPSPWALARSPVDTANISFNINSLNDVARVVTARIVAGMH